MMPVTDPSAPAVTRESAVRSAVRLLRPHQWAKNALAFLPALLAHRLGDVAVLTEATLAFVALSLCASGTYIVNDWLDRERDRQHPTKCRRPLASGALSPTTGAVLAAALITAAFAVALVALPLAFVVVLSAYTAVTLAYSLHLKRVAVLDVLLLAGLYALRVVAGGAATDIPVSEWLLAFSLFFFLALALLKRYVELRRIETGEVPADNGRGYAPDDAAMVRGMGPACGFLAVLVLALYTTSPEVRVLYARPDLLWLIVPPLLYWTMRMWLVAHRGKMSDDPVFFAVTDLPSYAVAALVVGVLALAS